MELLYHYCSTATFVSIVTRRAAWLSSMDQSNDHQEGKLLRQVIDRCDRQQRHAGPGLSDYLADEVEKEMRAFAMCLSTESDLLSQWRGYADDAQGFSIGFSKQWLQRACTLDHHGLGSLLSPMRLSPVIYEPAKQVELVQPYVTAVDAGWDAERDVAVEMAKPHALPKSIQAQAMIDIQRTTSTGWRAAVELAQCQYLLKSKAFSEEREWRLFFCLAQNLMNRCSFRARGVAVIPYMELDFTKVAGQAIHEVILGPKNPTPKSVVNAMLTASGFEGVKIEPSVASYC